MRYVKLTFQYMCNKHFWKLALMVLVPSVAISFFSSFGSTAHYLAFFFEQEDYSFKTVYHHISELDWKNLLILIAAAIILSVLLSIYIGTMQRHMRTGTFAITNIFKRINEHFIPSLIAVVPIFIMIYLYGLGLTISITVWNLITHNAIATLVLSIFSMVLLFLAMLYIISIFCMVTPHMVVTGARIKDAIVHSLEVTHDNIFKLFFAFAVPILLILGLQFAVCWINVRVVDIILDSLTMLFIGCYYPVLIFVAYYDMNDKDREDLALINKL